MNHQTVSSPSFHGNGYQIPEVSATYRTPDTFFRHRKSSSIISNSSNSYINDDSYIFQRQSLKQTERTHETDINGEIHKCYVSNPILISGEGPMPTTASPSLMGDTSITSFHYGPRQVSSLYNPANLMSEDQFNYKPGFSPQNISQIHDYQQSEQLHKQQLQNQQLHPQESFGINPSMRATINKGGMTVATETQLTPLSLSQNNDKFVWGSPPLSLLLSPHNQKLSPKIEHFSFQHANKSTSFSSNYINNSKSSCVENNLNTIFPVSSVCQEDHLIASAQTHLYGPPHPSPSGLQQQQHKKLHSMNDHISNNQTVFINTMNSSGDDSNLNMNINNPHIQYYASGVVSQDAYNRDDMCSHLMTNHKLYKSQQNRKTLKHLTNGQPASLFNSQAKPIHKNVANKPPGNVENGFREKVGIDSNKKTMNLAHVGNVHMFSNAESSIGNNNTCIVTSLDKNGEGKILDFSSVFTDNCFECSSNNQRGCSSSFENAENHHQHHFWSKDLENIHSTSLTSVEHFANNEPEFLFNLANRHSFKIQDSHSSASSLCTEPVAFDLRDDFHRGKLDVPNNNMRFILPKTAFDSDMMNIMTLNQKMVNNNNNRNYNDASHTNKSVENLNETRSKMMKSLSKLNQSDEFYPAEVQGFNKQNKIESDATKFGFQQSPETLLNSNIYINSSTVARNPMRFSKNSNNNSNYNNNDMNNNYNIISSGVSGYIGHGSSNDLNTSEIHHHMDISQSFDVTMMKSNDSDRKHVIMNNTQQKQKHQKHNTRDTTDFRRHPLVSEVDNNNNNTRQIVDHTSFNNASFMMFQGRNFNKNNNFNRNKNSDNTHIMKSLKDNIIEREGHGAIHMNHEVKLASNLLPIQPFQVSSAVPLPMSNSMVLEDHDPAKNTNSHNMMIQRNFEGLYLPSNTTTTTTTNNHIQSNPNNSAHIMQLKNMPLQTSQNNIIVDSNAMFVPSTQPPPPPKKTLRVAHALSFGSQYHERGTCTPCQFEWSKGCYLQAYCRFCHDPSHDPKGKGKALVTDNAIATAKVVHRFNYA